MTELLGSAGETPTVVPARDAPDPTGRSAPPPPWRSVLGFLEAHWGPVVVLLLGALLPMARVLPGFGSTLPGNGLGDVYKHAWSFWHALAAPGLWSDRLNAPDGGVILDVLWAPARLLAPVTAALGPVVACNLWLVVTFFAIGATTAGLAFELLGGTTAARWPAVAAGVCAQTSPFLLGYPLESGVHERLAVWVFPLVLLALIRVGRTGSLRWAAAGVVGLAICALGCQVYAVFAVVMGICCLPLWMAAEDRRHPAQLLGTLAAMAAVIGAVYLVIQYAAEHPRALSFQPGRVALSLGLESRRVDATTLGGLLDPRVAAAEVARGHGDVLIRTQYLGWAVLLPSLIGAVVSRDRRVIVVVIAGVIAALLSMGARFTLGGMALIDPLAVVFAWLVPTYGSTPPIWQQVAVAGPLLGVGFAAFVKVFPRALVGLPLLVLAERALVLPVPVVANVVNAQVSPVYDRIDDGVVVEIPRAWEGTDVAWAAPFLAQAVHGQPMPVAINIGSTTTDRYAPVLDGVSADWLGVTQCLRLGGTRWIVLHPPAFATPEAAVAAEAGLTAALGAPVAEDAETRLYDLGPADARAHAGPIVPGGSASQARRGRAVCPFTDGGAAGPR